MPAVNRSIPEFEVQAFHNGEFETVTNESVKGKWSIFIFYPADFTFVCPTELEDMQKHYAEFQALGAEVYSVSCDTHFTHKAWHDTSDAIKTITYPMLGDPTGVLARGFDVMKEDEGVAYRGTFLVDPEGIIQVAEIHNNSIGRDAKSMVRNLKASKYVAEHDGEVCPAAWEEGEKTLKPSLDLVGKI